MSEPAAEQLVDPAKIRTVGDAAIQTEYGWFWLNEDGTIDAPPELLPLLFEEGESCDHDYSPPSS